MDYRFSKINFFKRMLIQKIVKKEKFERTAYKRKN